MFHYVLRHLVSRQGRPAGRGRRPHPFKDGRRVRPRLEWLEDRWMPSIWLGGNGDWGDPTKWDTGHVPGSADDVAIPSGSLVTHAQTSADTVHSLSCDGALAISNGSLAMASDSTVNSLTLSGGRLTANGSLTLSGLFTWTSGTLDGTTGTVRAMGGINLTGFGVTLGTRLENDGRAVMDGPNSSLNLSVTGASFRNLSGATLEIRNNQGITGVSGTTVTNEGNILVQSPIQATIQPTFNNSGSVLLLTGSLRLTGDGTNSGSFSFNDIGGTPTTLEFAAGTHTMTNLSNVEVDNAVFSGGTVTIAGNYMAQQSTTVSGGTVVWQTAFMDLVGNSLNVTAGHATFNTGDDLTPAFLDVAGGTLDGSDHIAVDTLFNWFGGTMSGSGTTDVAGFLDLGGFGVSLGRTLNSATDGSLSGPNSSLTILTGGVLNNLPGAMFTLLNNQGIFGPGTFNNQGAIFREFGTGVMTISAVFNNSGSVEIRTGTLRLTGGGNATGSFTGNDLFPPDAALEFAAGYTLRAGSSVTVPNVVFSGGTVTVNDDPSQSATFQVTTSTTVSGGTVNFSPGANVNLGDPLQFNQLIVSGGTANFNDGAVIDVYQLELTGGTLTGIDEIDEEHVFQWYGGILSGLATTNANGLIEMNGSGVSLGRSLNNNYGAILFGPFSSLTILNGGIWCNMPGAGFEIRNNSAVFGPGNFFNMPGATVTRDDNFGSATFSATFNNDGVVDVQTGTLILTGNSNDGGSFTGASGATLVFAGGTHLLRAESSLTTPNVVFSGGNVQIDGTYDVAESTTAGGAAVVINSAVSRVGDRLTVSGGSLSFNGGGSVGGPTRVLELSLYAGTLGGTLNMEVEAFTWWGGDLVGGSGAGTTVDLSMDVASTSSKTLGRTLTNFGQALWTGNVDLAVNAGAVFNNVSDAVLRIENDQHFGIQVCSGTFNNSGTVIKDNSWGTTTFGVSFTGNPVDVQTGTVVYACGGPRTAARSLTRATAPTGPRLVEPDAGLLDPAIATGVGDIRTAVVASSAIAGQENPMPESRSALGELGQTSGCPGLATLAHRIVPAARVPILDALFEQIGVDVDDTI